MIPRDWLLVARGHADQAEAMKPPTPGAKAPSADDMAWLLENYG